MSRFWHVGCSFYQRFLTFSMDPSADIAIGSAQSVRVVGRSHHSATPAQEAIWLSNQLYPGSRNYHLIWEVRIAGRLDAENLIESLRWMVCRHDALRSHFIIEGDRLVQVVVPEVDPDCCYEDVEDLSAEAIDARIRQTGLSDYDLTAGPLVRFRLLRCAEERHCLVVAVHHLVFDGVSWPTFVEELSARYSGQGPARLTVSYGDFARWQSAKLAAGVWSQQENFWRERIETGTSIDLPLDRRRGAAKKLGGGTEERILPGTLVAKLKRLRSDHGTTLFRLLLSAFVVFLYRLTGQRTLLVGTTLSGRSKKSHAGLIGLANNAVVMRAAVDGTDCFAQVVEKVHREISSCAINQDFPFCEALRRFMPVRDLNSAGLANVAFIKLPSSSPEPIRVGETVWTEQRHFAKASLRDFSITVQERGNAIRLVAEFDATLLDAATITQLLDGYFRLLEEIAIDPRRRISEFPVFPPPVPLQVPAVAVPGLGTNVGNISPSVNVDETIAAKFESVVQRYPERSALKTKSIRWSYRELNEQANRIARRLIDSGAAPGAMIALLFDHDAAMIAAILGVLKAGCAYVPLDEFWPSSRIRSIVADTGAKYLLNDSHCAPLVRQAAAAGVVPINVDELDATLSITNPCSRSNPESLAYVLFTSGSSGTPKGVMQSQRNVLGHIWTYGSQLGLTADDRLSLFSSYCFDAAVMDIFGALLSGATLLPMRLRQDGPAATLDFMAGAALTVYHSTPSVFRALFEDGGEHSWPSIRRVVLGGEQCLKSDVELFKRNFCSGAILVNGFGPTESTLALQFFAHHDVNFEGDVAPIGRPVPGTEIYLLNQSGDAGTIYGEIAIKSERIALGYWRQPELTERAFFPDPAGSAARVYRTGDWGRLLPDGNVAFTGRRDFQIKLRGYRIELEEIEAALHRHPKVRDAVVAVQETRAGDKALVAYIVGNFAEPSLLGELKTFLAKTLPEPMVPMQFIELAALPLTANGKVNCATLPLPEEIVATAHEFVASQSDEEAALVRIFAKLLKRAQVGVHDNFFDLGGHSLVGVKLIGEIAREFGCQLPLTSLYEQPTVAQIACLVRQCVKAVVSPLIAVRTGGTKAPFFCVHGTAGYLPLTQYLGADRPFYGLAQHFEGRRVRYTRIEEIAAYYLSEVRKVQPLGPYHIGGHSVGAFVAFEMAQQLRADHHEVGLLALLDPFAPMASSDDYAVAIAERFDSAGFKSLHSDLKRKLYWLRQGWSDAVLHRCKSAACALLGYLNLPLPVALQSFYMEQVVFGRIYREAYARYRPRPYMGRAVYFASDDERERISAWAALVPTGLEVYSVPGDHLTMLVEPNVAHLAEALREVLNSSDSWGISAKIDKQLGIDAVGELQPNGRAHFPLSDINKN